MDPLADQKNCAVGFKDRPLGATVDRLLKGDEVAVEDDVLPLRIPADYNICNPLHFSAQSSTQQQFHAR